MNQASDAPSTLAALAVELAARASSPQFLLDFYSTMPPSRIGRKSHKTNDRRLGYPSLNWGLN